MHHSHKEIRTAIELKEESRLATFFNGSDYGVGKIEEIEKTADNLSHAIAKLLLLLVDRSSITIREATVIVSEYGTYDPDGDDED